MITSTRDMRAVYTRARTLLMPSLWEESYGRTVVEAQISGIPVVASKRGALPEVMGAGGLLVDAHAPISEWERALRGPICHPSLMTGCPNRRANRPTIRQPRQ